MLHLHNSYRMARTKQVARKSQSGSEKKHEKATFPCASTTTPNTNGELRHETGHEHAPPCTSQPPPRASVPATGDASTKTLTIHGVSVCFPCKPYPSQLSMMERVIKGLDKQQNCLLESPTGSGKSLALLCAALAWQTASYEESHDREFIIFSDSLSCLQALHSLKFKNPIISTILAKHSCLLSREKTVVLCWLPSHVGIRGNERVDSAAKEALNSPITDFKMLYTDFHYYIFKYIRTIWQSRWNEATSNKLHDLKPILGDWRGAYRNIRREEVVLCRCRIGHTLLTHSFILKGDTQPRVPKIYFGTRTHKQITQIIRELRKTVYKDVRMCILGSREHCCIHPQLSKLKNKTEACNEKLGPTGCGCKFNENSKKVLLSQSQLQTSGLQEAWDLEDFVSVCKARKACPYFVIRNIETRRTSSSVRTIILLTPSLGKRWKST
ncbi:hypothetical protein ScPMuIL_005489 [Solemya velum]